MIIRIRVNGMSCGHCAKSVQGSLEQISGVEAVEVNLQEKIATITSSTVISEHLIKNAIEEEGYEFGGIL